MARCYFPEGRDFDLAARLGDRTPRMKMAPRRWVDRTGHVPGDAMPAASQRWVGQRYRCQKCLGIRVERIFKQRYFVRVLNDTAQIHHGDAPAAGPSAD
jgi:hypothetical protein